MIDPPYIPGKEKNKLGKNMVDWMSWVKKKLKK